MRLICYGNPGRGDDGLGPMFGERVNRRKDPDLDVDIDYQLSVEHSMMVKDASCVVFVDALMGASEPFVFSKIEPASTPQLGSHSLTPEALLALSKSLYGRAPEAYVLGISGVEYGKVHEGLSDVASANLDAAEAFFVSWVKDRRR